ncbi:MAG: serine/threonine-protein kinase [Vicinamibacterales bacterium]
MAARLAIHQELGDYRVAEFLGAGGMGEVYRAVHRTSGREVAIKITGITGAAAPAGGSEAGDRFETEARIQASLSHPNIAAMHNYFEHGGRRCLVMEFVPGETLATRLARDRRIPAAAALALLKEVATAAAFMHVRRIVHRDLTPANIRITPDGRIKLLDFGIAQVEHRKGLTAEGEVIGTPAYLSPEQLRSGGATPQSDVWALGVLLFEMITGRPPFGGRFPSEVWQAIEKGRVPEVNGTLPAGDPNRPRVDAILRQCLAVDSCARFANAGELVAALAANATHDTHRTHGHRTHAQPTYPRTHHAVVWFAAAAVAVLVFVASRESHTAPPTSVHRIDVTEGVAEVLINGRHRGRTPHDYTAAAAEIVTIELRQEGFLPVRQRFVVTERPVWTFSMRRQP